MMRLIYSFLSFLFSLNLIHAVEVLTISDSIVDYVLYVDEEFISSIPGKKGGSELVDDPLFRKIIQESGSEPMIRPGASAVNTVKGLSRLGHECALITTIGNDEAGEFFLKSLQDEGILLTLQKSSTPTGKSACMVTPNGERTMRTFLGASKENGKLQLQEDRFKGISHFHLEGYQLMHRKVVLHAISLSRQQHATISLDLSSFEVVRANKEFIWELLKTGCIDVIFANQEEALTLTDLPPKEAAALLGDHCAVSVVTMGENGCYVQEGTSQWRCPAIPVNLVDTIGAGDLFISGFLHGYLTEKPVHTCASIGTLLASHVIQVLGAEIPHGYWQAIHEKILFIE
jgi:sugar/nucleoside kinase (ribokinase family)